MYETGSGIDIGKESDQFLHNLKKATAEKHAMLESTQLLAALMHPRVSIHHYYCYLMLMLNITRKYEETVLSELLFLFPESKHLTGSTVLADDLLHVLPETLLPSRPEEYTLPEIKFSVPQALGFMYVMEGSKLGGMVIFKHIQKRLGFTANKGAKYIADLGSDTMPAWRKFVVQFSGYVVKNNLKEEVIEGAGMAFSSINRYFELNRELYEV